LFSQPEDRPAVQGGIHIAGCFGWAVFTLIAIVAFWNRELWSDEAVTLLLASGHDPGTLVAGIYEPKALREYYAAIAVGPLDVWSLAAARDNHPPGYPSLISMIASAIGAEELHVGWLRALNAALTGFFVFPAFALFRRFGEGRSWLLLAAIVFSPFAFYLARELRAYGLILPLGLTAAWLCLRVREGSLRPVSFLVAILVVNVAGCLLHRLFVGIVAAEVAYLAAIAVIDGTRRGRFIALTGAVALGSFALTLPIPNLLSTAPIAGQFETAWLHSPLTVPATAEAGLSYLGYFLSWWIVPPDDLFATTVGLAFLIAFAPLALVLVALALREIARTAAGASALLVGVPLTFLLALFLVMGVDLSKSPRFSVIWVPLAAIWLVAGLDRLRWRRALIAWVALATVCSSFFVLANLAHTSPDGARRFAAMLPHEPQGSFVWLDDGTLNARGLLLSLHSELEHAGMQPVNYRISAAESGEQITALIIAAPRRLTAILQSRCANGEIVSARSYAACVVR
jgi:hypothetical protein